jgi:hypothetical protein
LSLVGDASITVDNRLRLTPAVGGQEGAAWYTAAMQFVGLSFETSFQFQMTENFDPPGGSDGLVFIIQNHAPTYLAGGGGTLGYDLLPNSLAIEFDTFQNSEVNDPSPSHISIHTNGTGLNGWSESLSLGSYSTMPALLDDAAIHTVTISYSPGTLAVYLDDMVTPKLTVAVDVAELLNLDAGTAWVGFTATTGGGWQNHDVLNWTYTVLDDVSSTTVWIGDGSAVEGNSGSTNVKFMVTRAGNTSGTTTVDWSTADRTATAGIDYTAASGQVVFGPGDTQQSIMVQTIGDTALEGHEKFVVRLASPVGASVVDGVGIGTILNDDVTISIGDAVATEGDSAVRFTDAFVSAMSGGLLTPRNIAFGPDGKLYVAGQNSDSVQLYDGTTGTFLDVVIPSSAGLGGAWALDFGPDGNLYAAGALSNNVLRYNLATSVIDEYISPGAFGLSQPKGMLFGPDGNLYISSTTGGGGIPGPHRVLRFGGPNGPSPGSPLPAPGQTGAVFVADGSGGLSNPNGLAFGPDGNLYVANTFIDSVTRYSGSSGAFIDTFVAAGSGGLDAPTDMEFRDGEFFVSGQFTDAVLVYDAGTGAYKRSITGGGLDSPNGIEFDAFGNMYVAGSLNHQVLRFAPASVAAFTIVLSDASVAAVTVDYATANGTALGGSDFTPVAGSLTFSPGETTKAILVQTLNNAATEPTETFTLELTNPTAATITDSQGLGTILDNDTKFYVVNDATSNQTYEYASGSVSGESYNLDAGNAAPRGAASNAAGTTVWVVDANKKVYVYDPSGGLLGSWTAGSLASNATVEGVATNGTDVWIVDAKQDKVFKYTGAASRLSGSQNAASSFSLNSGNRSPKDIVTDGVHFWVVNDSTTDKVFKYTVAGSLVGSWTINTAGAGSPTGITIDPTDLSDIWIVDSATDRVYQYTAAASRTSGSQSAATSFALAAGNTNPQGIADPPVAIDSVASREASDISRANETDGVPAVDRFLIAEQNERGRVRSDSIADDFIETLFGFGQRRAKLRGLGHRAG